MKRNANTGKNDPGRFAGYGQDTGARLFGLRPTPDQADRARKPRQPRVDHPPHNARNTQPFYNNGSTTQGIGGPYKGRPNGARKRNV